VTKILEKNVKKRFHIKAIESSKERALEAADQLERTIVLNGDGLDEEVLKESNIGLTDFFIAVTNDDKTNLLACARAKALGCKFTMALINDPSLSKLLTPMGVDAFINPRTTTVSSILRHIRHGMVKTVYSIGNGEAEVLEFQVMDSSPIIGKTLKEIEWPDGSLVGIVKKETRILIPKGDTQFEQGDSLTVFCLRNEISKVENLFQVGVDFF
jgi:trk system potassium uptake protein TrkA